MHRYYQAVIRGLALASGAYLARAVYKQFGLLGLLLFPFIMLGVMAFTVVGVIYTGLGILVGALYTDYLISIAEPFTRELRADSSGYLMVNLTETSNWSLQDRYASKYVIISEKFIVVETIGAATGKAGMGKSVFGIEENSEYRPYGVHKFDVIPQSRYLEYKQAISNNAEIWKKNSTAKQKNINHDNAELVGLHDIDEFVFDRIRSNESGEHPNYVFMGCAIESPCSAVLTAKLMPSSLIQRGFYYAWNWRDQYMLLEEQWKLNGQRKEEERSSRAATIKKLLSDEVRNTKNAKTQPVKSAMSEAEEKWERLQSVADKTDKEEDKYAAKLALNRALCLKGDRSKCQDASAEINKKSTRTARPLTELEIAVKEWEKLKKIADNSDNYEDHRAAAKAQKKVMCMKGSKISCDMLKNGSMD
jgi:hypothetical protein